MKKSVIFTAAAGLMLLAIPLSAAANEKPFRTEQAEYRTVRTGVNDSKYREIITRKQLDKDLDMLCYLIRTQYVGYEDAAARGLNLDSFTSAVREDFRDCSKINIEDESLSIYRHLKDYISDTHFSVNSALLDHKMTTPERIFYTDIYVREDDGTFTVFRSSIPEIHEGQEYTGSTDNLFYYPSMGEKVYRIGGLNTAEDFSITNTEDVEVSIDGSIFTVKAKCEAPISTRQTARFNEKLTEKTAYISMSNFMPVGTSSIYKNGTDSNFEKFVNSALDCQDKDYVIMDIRGNTGGFDLYGLNFLTLLYSDPLLTKTDFGKDYASNGVRKYFYPFKQKCITKCSPATAQYMYDFYEELGADSEELEYYRSTLQYFKTTQRAEWYYGAGDYIDPAEYNSLPDLPETPYFKGKLIILTDRNSASASELTCSYAKLLFKDQAVITGENTMGCITYGGVSDFCLPESGLHIRTSGTTYEGYLAIFPSWHGESTGFFPDVWSTGEDLLKTLIVLTGDESLSEPLQYLEWALQ